MTLLCAAGVIIIGAALILISLYISEGQLKERGQALFTSAADTIAFSLGTENVIDWTWLSRTEADSGIFVSIEDNGAPIMFSGRGDNSAERESLVNRAVLIALEKYGVDIKKRPASALNNNRADFIMDTGGDEYRVCVIAMRTDSGYKSLTVLGDTSREREQVFYQRLRYLGLLLAAAAAMLLFTWWFTGRAIKPIAKSQRQQAEFVAAASHELKTPLSVIRGNAAALMKKGGEEPFAGVIERECERTGKLVDDLLVLSGADAGVWRVNLVPVELPQVLKESAESFKPATEAKNQKLELVLPSYLPLIAGDELRIRQICGILLDNACYYTGEGGVITVSAFAKRRAVGFSVADNGPGIPIDERERVFERFYRLDKARTQKGRYGLGLPIAREIARLHGGGVILSDTPGGGLTVTVKLPTATGK